VPKRYMLPAHRSSNVCLGRPRTHIPERRQSPRPSRRCCDQEPAARGLGCIGLFVAGATFATGSTLKSELECTGVGLTEQAIHDEVASGCWAKVRQFFKHRGTESTEIWFSSTLCPPCLCVEIDRRRAFDRAPDRRHHTLMIAPSDGGNLIGSFLQVPST